MLRNDWGGIISHHINAGGWLPPCLTSRKHDESFLQHLVSFVSSLITFFRIHVFLLTEVEVAKCCGKCKVWQLGQISVLLKCSNKPYTRQVNFKMPCNYTHMSTTAVFTSQSWYSWSRDWYSLVRSIRKSMSRSMQSGSASGSKLF